MTGLYVDWSGNCDTFKEANSVTVGADRLRNAVTVYRKHGHQIEPRHVLILMALHVTYLIQLGICPNAPSPAV